MQKRALKLSTDFYPDLPRHQAHRVSDEIVAAWERSRDDRWLVHARLDGSPLRTVMVTKYHRQSREWFWAARRLEALEVADFPRLRYSEFDQV